MGTRSIIALQAADSFQTIYCHWDGYPSGVGTTLEAHYVDPAKVAALISLGDISTLGVETDAGPGMAHSFTVPAPGVTVAYRRDRGETGTGTGAAADVEALFEAARDCWAEYIYVFAGGAWLFAPVPDDGAPTADFATVRAELCEAAQ